MAATDGGIGEEGEEMVHESFTSTGDTDINNTFHTEEHIGEGDKSLGRRQPFWDEVFYLCLVPETHESALSHQVEESTVCVLTVGFITLHQA